MSESEYCARDWRLLDRSFGKCFFSEIPLSKSWVPRYHVLFAVNLLRHQIKMLKSGVADCIDDCHKFTNFYLLICAYLYGLFFINLPQAGEFRFQRL